MKESDQAGTCHEDFIGALEFAPLASVVLAVAAGQPTAAVSPGPPGPSVAAGTNHALSVPQQGGLLKESDQAGTRNEDFIGALEFALLASVVENVDVSLAQDHSAGQLPSLHQSASSINKSSMMRSSSSEIPEAARAPHRNDGRIQGSFFFLRGRRSVVHVTLADLLVDLILIRVEETNYYPKNIVCYNSCSPFSSRNNNRVDDVKNENPRVEEIECARWRVVATGDAEETHLGVIKSLLELISSYQWSREPHEGSEQRERLTRRLTLPNEDSSARHHDLNHGSRLGTDCERLGKSSRWLASQYAMIRHGRTTGVTEPVNIAGEDNVADIVTKALTGKTYLRHRATLLGHAH